MAGMTTTAIDLQATGRAVLCAAAPYSDEALAYWRTLLRDDDTVVAADGGLLLARRLGREPQLLVGDGDSLAPAVMAACTVPRYPLPVKKDDTDTLAAARLIAAQGFTQALLLGGWGGRLDHALANLGVLAYWQEAGVQACLADEHGLAWLMTPGTQRLDPHEYAGFSLLPFGDIATGVTIRDAVYPLTDATLRHAFPVGVSNEFCEKPVEITLKTGRLLVYLRKTEK